MNKIIKTYILIALYSSVVCNARPSLDAVDIRSGTTALTFCAAAACALASLFSYTEKRNISKREAFIQNLILSKRLSLEEGQKKLLSIGHEKKVNSSKLLSTVTGTLFCIFLGCYSLWCDKQNKHDKEVLAQQHAQAENMLNELTYCFQPEDFENMKPDEFARLFDERFATIKPFLQQAYMNTETCRKARQHLPASDDRRQPYSAHSVLTFFTNKKKQPAPTQPVFVVPAAPALHPAPAADEGNPPGSPEAAPPVAAPLPGGKKKGEKKNRLRSFARGVSGLFRRGSNPAGMDGELSF